MLARSLPAVLVVLSCIASASASEDTVYSHYTVSGQTPLEIMRAITARSQGQDGWHEVAYVKPTFNYRFRFDRTGGMCRPSGFRIDKRFEIVLPQLAAPEALPVNDLKSWQDFYGYLKWHEHQHRLIHLECLEEAEVEVLALPPQRDCDQLKKAVGDIRDRSMRMCRRKHALFDEAEASVIVNLPFMKTALDMARRR